MWYSTQTSHLREGLSPFQWMFLGWQEAPAPSSYSTVQIGRVINQPDNKDENKGEVLMDHIWKLIHDLKLICDFHCPMSLMVRLNRRCRKCSWLSTQEEEKWTWGSASSIYHQQQLAWKWFTELLYLASTSVGEYPWKILLNTSINSVSQNPSMM